MGNKCTVTPLVLLTIHTLIYDVSNHPRPLLWAAKAMEAFCGHRLHWYLDTAISKVDVLSSLQRRVHPSLMALSFH